MTRSSGADQSVALAAALAAAAAEHKGSEANFRRSAERALEESAEALGIEVESVVERSLAGGRADAVFYWITVDGPADDQGRIPITNLHDAGRTSVTKKYGRVEAELVHPLVRGSNVTRWNATPSDHILFVQDPAARRGIDEATMKEAYGGALDFLADFKQLLRRRSGFRRYYTKMVEKRRIELAPYWSMFNVGDYTLKPHKVVWKDQASDFAAAVMPVLDPLPLPNHKVMLVACESADEAHYLCGALNSVPVRLFVACYAIETQISTHTVTYVHVPKFDPKSRSHQALAESSRRAHEAVSRGLAPDQSAVDRAAARLWGLRVAEIEAMRVFFDELRKRDLVPA